MKISGTEDIKLNNTVVTVGKFDCFHKGHQLLFYTASEMKKEGMELVMFMFDIRQGNPSENNGGKYIVSMKERRELARYFGIDHCIEYPFSEKTRRMTPEEFVKDILIEKLGVKALVAGDDFRFGINRSGDVNTLKSLGEKNGFDVRIVERLKYKGKVISSTEIREELLKGNLTDVNNMLGRSYSITGTVLKGAHVGSKMGVPTINLEIPEDKLLPPFGVYASKVIAEGREYEAITNIGVRPTFYENSEVVAETNLLDYEGEMYGKKVTVELHEHVRSERRFADPSELYEQIASDIRKVREYFGINKENTEC